MRHGRQEILLTLAVTSLLLLAPAKVFGQASGTLDLATLLPSRDPATMVGSIKDDDMQEKVKDRWVQLLTEDSKIATERNHSKLYPNPSLQAYVNRLGLSLIPKQASENIYVNFRIVEDPVPYADSLATGTVYMSTGMISLLDNESQLAFLLMHEAGHVILSHHLFQFIEEAKAEKRANRMKIIGAVAGAKAKVMLRKERLSASWGPVSWSLPGTTDS